MLQQQRSDCFSFVNNVAVGKRKVSCIKIIYGNKWTVFEVINYESSAFEKSDFMKLLHFFFFTTGEGEFEARQFPFTSSVFYYPKESCLFWNSISILLTQNLINIYKLISLSYYILFGRKEREGIFL